MLDAALMQESLLHGRAYEFMAALCELDEHRFAGSAGDRAAVAYLQRAMADIGLTDVGAEPFPFTAWQRGPTALELLDAPARRLDVLALAGSRSADVEAELADVGFGTEEEFADLGAAVQGKIVLVRAGSPAYLKRYMYRGAEVIRARRYGAVGLLLMNTMMGLLPLAGSRGFEQDEMPAASVSYEVGMALARRLKTRGGARLRLRMQHTQRAATGYNVVGALAGRAWPEHCLTLGAHYDSHDIAPGATDDAAGVAVMLETARLLRKLDAGIGRSLRLIAFGVEELGLLGAEAYVVGHAADLDGVALMLNLDCAGGPGSKDLTVHGWPALHGLLQQTMSGIADFGYADFVSSTHSDHFPFLLAGVPTATLTGNAQTPADKTGQYMHTAADTLDKRGPDEVQTEALRVARAILRLSWAQPWPAPRRPAASVKELLQDAGILDDLAREGRFPFERV